MVSRSIKKEMKLSKLIPIFLIQALFSVHLLAQDTIANNMLLYQRGIGGWPKHIGEQRIDYTRSLSPAEKAGLLDDKNRNDATIDNNATTKEIRYLVKAYQHTCNFDYLIAAESGISYLLKMQYANG